MHFSLKKTFMCVCVNYNIWMKNFKTIIYFWFYNLKKAHLGTYMFYLLLESLNFDENSKKEK